MPKDDVGLAPGLTPGTEVQARWSEDGLQEILNFLLAPTVDEADSLWPAAERNLRLMFEEDRWGIDKTTNAFSNGGRPNLFRVEMPSQFRTWLLSRDVDEAAYADAISDVQYNSAQVWLLKLFQGSRRSNEGWRLRVVGFPSLQTIAVGLGSNYQGTQNHNAMGNASALIRGAAQGVLASDSDLSQIFEGYPSATAEHWDDRGLIVEPVLKVGDLDISEFDPDGARLRMARNTTVKKELATFFCIRGFSPATFLKDGEKALAELGRIATALGE